MQQESESVYIDKVLAGDIQAFEYLIKKHQRYVFTIAYKILKNREEAEEVAQDTFLKVYQSLHTFQKKAKFSTWLYRICYHMSLNRLKVYKKTHTQDLEEGLEIEDHTFESQFAQLQQTQQKVYIEAAIQQLAAEEAVIITLFYLAENTIEEIAEITEINKNNIKVKLHRARKKLYTTLSHMLKSEVKELL